MKQLNQILTAVLIGASLTASMGAMAHGDEDHAKKAVGPVKKEQKDWGIAGDAKDVKRTIELTMGDNMRFTPDHFEVRQGEVVKFVVRNSGQMLHEMVIGNKKELDEHAALMVKFPNMEHDEPYMAHVGPGKSSQMIWSFNRAGDFDFACLMAGHYQAGMVGKIKVVGTGKIDASAASAGSPGTLGSPALVKVQSTAPDAAAAPARPATPATAAADMTDAEVRKIDKENRKVTLKHGDIKNLDMPGMTMVFEVNDVAALDKLQVGDKIRFRAASGGGKLLANDIQPAK
jgi:uncharacterized cupredoxin-like copper-binding protein/Cu/Ag efflux protein CusF